MKFPTFRKRVNVSRESPLKTLISVTVPLCPTCSSLDLTAILRNGVPQHNKIPLGSLVDILQRADQCRFCHLVASLFRRCWCLDVHPDVDLSGVVCSVYAPPVGASTNPHPEKKERCHRLRIDHSKRPPKISDAMFKAHTDLVPDLQLLEEDAHKLQRTKETHGRRIADTVDMGLVKRWITLCEREHGDKCKLAWWRGNELQLPSFVRMVDVARMSVVRSPRKCRYMALSYVWGMAGNSYWTNKTNINSRSKPAGLDLSALPATIVDAIHVTRALGERYLWIDALCIIQDDSKDKHDQIHAMDLIYSGAVITIVAAGGDSAHARLPGFSSGSRSLHQQIEVIQDLHLAIPLPSLREAIAHTIWDTRGWTLQEHILSRRRLFFTKYQVYFECTENVWCEDLAAETMPYHPMRWSGSGVGLSFLTKQPRPGLSYIVHSYGYVVEQYSRRHLTYPSDVIHAITAITNAMSKGYHRWAGGKKALTFRYGIQVWSLDHSLLWQPILDSVPARRTSPDMAFPSWAWAGWTGAVCYSGLYQFTQRYSDTQQEEILESLISGWHIVDDHRRLIDLHVEKILFRVAGDPELGAVAPASYPVPEDDIAVQQLGPLPPTGTLIFRTQCASFKISKLEDLDSGASGSHPFSHTIFHILSDARRPLVPVGRLILPSSTTSPTTLELIVLSRIGDMRGLYEEEVYGKGYFGCLLNVMAVRRVGSEARIRERVGLGVIFEQAWLECGAKVETVFLG